MESRERLRTMRLRVSLLQQCQYDCAYCRPGSVSRPIARSRWLSAGDYARLAPFFAAVGVEKIRLTGGEPLLREDVVAVVRAFREAAPHCELAMTTNGLRLGAQLEALAAAGLDGATVHIDSLRPDRYRALMAPGELETVLQGLARAQRTLSSVKVNVVLQRGKNDDELPDFLDWSERTGIEVRFIEVMNTGSARAVASNALTAGEALARIERTTSVTRLGRRDPADPALLFRSARGVTFGLIASDSQPFCAACNRLRLSADGHLRGCLYQPAGAPIGDALRRGVGDRELEFMIGAAAGAKVSHHPSTGRRGEAFSMADAGG